MPLYVSRSPLVTGVVGQIFTMRMAGADCTGQMVVTVAVAARPSHLALAATLSVLVMVQAFRFAGTVKLPVKFVVWPGARANTRKTVVPDVGRLLVTMTLVSVMLPVFMTVALNTSGPPIVAGTAGH